jgi:hypothetical protein
MSKTDKIMLVNKSIEEQIEELKRLYKIEFIKKPVEQQEAIIKKLTYDNSKYDVDRLAEYLTNSNNNNNNEETESNINLEEELLNRPLIKKDTSTNSSEVISNLETNILNVEPEIQLEESKKESDGANNSESESGNKKVSFSEVDTSSSDSSNTNTTKTIKL